MTIKSLRQVVAAALLPATLLTVHGNVNADGGRVDEGRRLAHDFEKGNCLACHAAPTDAEAVTKANIAPPFIAMRERFEDREALRSQIWDAATRNPDTIMPPFGKHLILSNDEIELIIDYLYTL